MQAWRPPLHIFATGKGKEVETSCLVIQGLSGGLVIETLSLPNLLVATLATLPSMSLIPSAPFPLDCKQGTLQTSSENDFRVWGRVDYS